ncbi:MAG: hypothetical protein AB7I34_04390 [Rhizobiaceae bacterium]
MEFRAANEQQQETRWRVFLMFVVMALLIIRTGLVSRELRGQLTFFPPAPALKRHDFSAEKSNLSPCTYLSPSPDDLNQAILVLLCLAEAAGRLLILKERAVWELMNQPLPRSAQERPLNAASLRDRPAQRLDTS